MLCCYYKSPHSLLSSVSLSLYIYFPMKQLVIRNQQLNCYIVHFYLGVSPTEFQVPRMASLAGIFRRKPPFYRSNDALKDRQNIRAKSEWFNRSIATMLQMEK